MTESQKHTMLQDDSYRSINYYGNEEEGVDSIRNNCTLPLQ